MQRTLDRERTVLIDGCGTAADIVTLEHEHALSGPRVERSRG